MKRQHFWVVKLVCAAIVFWTAGLECPGQSRDGTRGPMVGRRAPAFQVQGIFSEDYSLEQFKGHILVMQFGTSW